MVTLRSGQTFYMVGTMVVKLVSSLVNSSEFMILGRENELTCV